MTTQFEFIINGDGWYEITFSNNENSYHFEYSGIGLSDPIIVLLESLNSLHNNTIQNSKIVFPGEPGEQVIYLTKTNEKLIEIEIHSNEEWEEIRKAYKTSSNGQIEFKYTDTLHNFSKKVVEGLLSMLEKPNDENYNSTFYKPLEELKQIHINLVP